MKKIYRSNTDKKLAGICGGLSEMFNIDSTIIRLSVVFLTAVTGFLPMILTYIIGWLVIPEKNIE